MKTALIKYHLRLGDILRSLPLAEKLASEGYAVTFECNEEYHSLFERVPYCNCSAPGEWEHDNFNLFIDLEVWPERYSAYRMSDKRWTEFVLGEYMEIGEYDPIPTLEVKPLDLEPIQICSPFSISGTSARYFFFSQESQARKRVLCAPHQAHIVDPQYQLVAKSIPNLIDLIAHAEWFATVNSAPTVIASAVRESYHHVVAEMINDDYKTEKQKRTKL